jgi:hypothetical protein
LTGRSPRQKLWCIRIKRSNGLSKKGQATTENA